ncbi:MAG: VanW family protein [Bacteriovorax sp.]|nr:VanW family protein [Bacteriovorax sp.]
MKKAIHRNCPVFTNLWVTFECPVVNHPSQAHLLPSKVFNMQLACEKLDGVVLKPNEIFSFWRIIGKPSKENGYLAGPTFERGEIVTSSGGGLCQISGLLYNLALCSGLKILERHPHSIDAYGEDRYLPLARDATVVWLSKDLCFQNITTSELQITIKASNDKTEAQVLGTIPMYKKVEITHFSEQDSFRDGKSFRHAKIVRIIADANEEIQEDFGWNQYRINN